MSHRLTIAVASDLSGFPLKTAIADHLRGKAGVSLLDLGIDSEKNPRPYYEQAARLAVAVQKGEAECGVLVCGTGQGMAIVANKHRGVYACVANGVFSGERARIINNANVLTLGGWITAPVLGIRIVESWLGVRFTEKMELKRDFLVQAFQQVQEIEGRNFK
jgi:ribose 5-phosphate isomerase B